MNWSKIPPASRGYYWAREEGDPLTEHIVEVFADGSIAEMAIEGFRRPAEIGDLEFWDDRIERPVT